jgi:hypothetical protein
MRKFFIAAAVAVVSLLSSVRSAEAAYAITVYVDGFATTLASSPSNVPAANKVFGAVGIPVGDGTVAGADLFTVSITAQSLGYPGNQAGALMSNTFNTGITTNFGPGGDTHTIAIVISQSGWTSPPGNPLTLSLSGSGSIGNVDDPLNPGRTVSVTTTNQGFLTPLSSGPETSLTPAGGSTTLAQALASITGTGTNNNVPFTPDPALASVPGGTPFTLTEVLSFTVTTDGANQGSAGFSGTLTATAPAPAGLVLALAGLPTLGLGAWIRRRRQAV